MTLRPLLVLAAMAVTPLAAMADTLDQFTLTGEGNTFTFSLPSSPTPTAVDANCPSGFTGEFCLAGVSVSIVGGTDTATMEFFNAANGGGLAFDTLSLFGDQLYTGTETSPTFLPGTYALESGATTFPDYTLQIRAVTPEPASWLLLSSGLLGGVTALRRRFAS